MSLLSLNKLPAVYKKSTRVGRGFSSGHGKTCGRGHKGQKSRSGVSRLSLYSTTGQTPLYRSLPKRGFNSVNQIFNRRVQAVSLNRLSQKVLSKSLSGDITKNDLLKYGLIRDIKNKVKLLNSLHFKEFNISSIEIDLCSDSIKEKMASMGIKVNLLG